VCFFGTLLDLIEQMEDVPSSAGYPDRDIEKLDLPGCVLPISDTGDKLIDAMTA
jgi:hypothetical protein